MILTSMLNYVAHNFVYIFQAYQAELERVTEIAKKKGKAPPNLSSAPWKNAEHIPLCLPGDGNIAVIDAMGKY